MTDSAEVAAARRGTGVKEVTDLKAIYKAAVSGSMTH